MKNSIFGIKIFAFVGITLICFLSCGGRPNTVNDPHFDEDGYLIKDTLNSSEFVLTIPNRIRFFIEVSGSMNGFFRANAPTKFKEDVWRVLSYYAPIAEDITILTNDGSTGASVSISDFQNKMNTGAFISAASTKVPVMLQSIINSINADAGDVAVLISDMKYSPVGSKAPEVLLTQYSTDISTIFGRYGKAICLVGATSEFLDKKGNSMCDKSPYYFLIIGKPEYVANLRNGISTLLENNEDFIGNIESGFDYGAPTYDFGIPKNCFQMGKEPTFLGYDESYGDTCVIKLKVDLAKYRWAAVNKDLFPQIFHCKALYGSEVKVGNLEYVIQNITNKELVRTAYAIVDLKVYNMPMESDVVEWTLQIPDLDFTEFYPYLDAKDENDVTKTYSLENFLKGMFYGGVVNNSMKPNYILISKKS